MSRIIFVPQYTSPLRYQFWWLKSFKDFFKECYDEVIVLGEKYLEDIQIQQVAYGQIFSPIDLSIKFELEQIKEYQDLQLQDDDSLFMSDLSFPGFFANILYHKKPKKCYAYCHATSKNYMDYFHKERSSKFMVETGHSKLFDFIFVGSEYHQNKLKWNNTIVSGLPAPPDSYISQRNVKRDKSIISVNRVTPQKVSVKFEKRLEKMTGYKIERFQCKTWDEYSELLSSAKILFISSKEDTFNYTIVDAIKCGCVPVAPSRLCFPEILPHEYLYTDEYNAFSIINNILSKKNLRVPKIQTSNVEHFFHNLKPFLMV